MSKKIILFLIFGLMFLFILDFISAFAISPIRTTLDFNSGVSERGQFSVVNSEHKDMNLVFYVRGDLKDYVVLDNQFAEISSDEDSKFFTYAVNFPKTMDNSKTKKTEIVAVEVPLDYSAVEGTDNYMGESLAVVLQLYVNGLYPDNEINNSNSGSGMMGYVKSMISRLWGLFGLPLPYLLFNVDNSFDFSNSLTAKAINNLNDLDMDNSVKMELVIQVPNQELIKSSNITISASLGKNK